MKSVDCKLLAKEVVLLTIKNKKAFIPKNKGFCGLDGTRTRDPLRDRQVF